MLNKIILAFLEPFLFLSGKSLLFHRIFTVSVKMPKISLFHVQSQKLKCLVLSRNPHSDTQIPFLGVLSHSDNSDRILASSILLTDGAFQIGGLFYKDQFPHRSGYGERFQLGKFYY